MLKGRYDLFKQFKEGKTFKWNVDEEIHEYEEVEKEFTKPNKYGPIGSHATHDGLPEIEPNNNILPKTTADT